MVVHRTERLCHCPKKKGAADVAASAAPQPCILFNPCPVFRIPSRMQYLAVWHFRIKNVLPGCRVQRIARATARCRMALRRLLSRSACPVRAPRRLMIGPGNIAVKRRDARARSCRFVRCCLTGSRSRCPANCLHTCLSTAPAIPSVFVSPALCWAISADCRSRCRAQRSCWLCR